MTDLSSTPALPPPDPYQFDTPLPSDEEFFGFLESRRPIDPEVPIREVPHHLRGPHMAYQVWVYDDLGVNLTVEEQLFVRSYMIDRNEISALRRLGYVTQTSEQCKRIAHRFLRIAEVQKAIELAARQMMNKLEISAENVNRKIADVAFTNVTDIAVFDGITSEIIPSHLWPEHARTAIKSVSNGQFGLKVEFYDKQKALDFLAKQVGLSDSDKTAEERAAEAAAEAAILKIMGVVQRTQEMKQAKTPLIENNADEPQS